MDTKKLIQEYLSDSLLVQIASSAKDIPWICSVWFAFDDELRIYWTSSKQRRHSLEIQENSDIALSVVHPSMNEGYGQVVRGIQIQAKAHRLSSEKERSHAHATYGARFPLFLKNCPIESFNRTDIDSALYCAIPTQIKLFDVKNFPDNPEQIIEL